ncbi:MAG: menaquinone biosynthesis decarboxylase [Bacteroidetes bacterium]|nr:menaquinone biosynthesis decarboxylase [Bacteroidota bacterium]MCW5895907.1 menaquinone biosynthesis decarboxylase [Bacteroidota bacterium]
MTTYRTLGDYARYLESAGELHRVRVEVDSYLEITEIATRAIKERRPALLFENVKGSKYPLVINTMASEHRCELALNKHPEQLGEELIRFMLDAMPPKPSVFWKHKPLVGRFLKTRNKSVSSALVQEVVEGPNLDELPILTCWPEDGGRFITLPQVVTYDPRNGKRNIGMYRMHVFDKQTTGMHWQIQKGGGFHYYEAERLGRDFELAVALGTDPALLMATIAALPENIDEAMFAGFLRGQRTEFVKAKSLSIQVPANAEFVLEGVVPARERRMEGPFGDHFGHYSHAAEFPVFHLKKITHRINPVYPATVVGIPPMEDKWLGDATQQILGPLIKLIHSEITNMWAYYEAGFHNLLVVAVDQRYQKEAMKTALGLMGMSQLSLTKCIILVSEGVNVRNFDEVMKNVRDNFDPHFDFVMIPKVPLDTLDFTSFKMNLGSKMILDATMKQRTSPESPMRNDGGNEKWRGVKSLDRRIVDANFVHDALLLVKVSGEGRSVVEKLVVQSDLAGIKVIAAVSEDVDIHDKENYIWGVFTRFDCERDVIFTEQKLHGISPIYKGVMGIDATWKPGYPNPLRMTDEVKKRVEERWDAYWK